VVYEDTFEGKLPNNYTNWRLPRKTEEKVFREAFYTRLKEKMPNKYIQLWMEMQRKWENPQKGIS
jgi:hypothetical protein